MKFTNWYNSLSPQTQEYLDSQPIWHDADIAIAFLIGFVLGALTQWMS